jgi:hypothetical protein
VPSAHCSRPPPHPTHSRLHALCEDPSGTSPPGITVSDLRRESSDQKILKVVSRGRGEKRREREREKQQEEAPFAKLSFRPSVLHQKESHPINSLYTPSRQSWSSGGLTLPTYLPPNLELIPTERKIKEIYAARNLVASPPQFSSLVRAGLQGFGRDFRASSFDCHNASSPAYWCCSKSRLRKYCP